MHSDIDGIICLLSVISIAWNKSLENQQWKGEPNSSLRTETTHSGLQASEVSFLEVTKVAGERRNEISRYNNEDNARYLPYTWTGMGMENGKRKME